MEITVGVLDGADSLDWAIDTNGNVADAVDLGFGIANKEVAAFEVAAAKQIADGADAVVEGEITFFSVEVAGAMEITVGVVDGADSLDGAIEGATEEAVEVVTMEGKNLLFINLMSNPISSIKSL